MADPDELGNSGRKRKRSLGHRYEDVRVTDNARAVLGDTYHIKLDDTLHYLPHAEDAPFNSFAKQHEPACLPDTRVALLNEIHSWADGQDERCIFWLSGLAGTGKSTIARTVARRYFEEKRLAASFFFSRGGGDVGHAGKFVTSIAVQLAHNVPASRQYISDAVAGCSNIASQSLRDQWQQLVCRPLSKLHDLELGPEPQTYVMVVDALDECDNDIDIRVIVQLLAEARSSSTGVRLRVLLTSRPEVPIRHGLMQIADTEHKDVVLHDISPSIVNHDIELFLKHHLRLIAKECYQADDWPGAEAIGLLVQSASGLFIWAATACRFIENGGQFIADRLRIILKDSSFADKFPGDSSSSEDSFTDGSSEISPQKRLDSIYLTVLKSPVRRYRKQERKTWYTRIREALGAIVLLQSPLSASSLARLLRVPVKDVHRTLHELHSILDVPQNPDQPVRLHHPSFRDFLLDKQRCGDDSFWVDENSTHEKLVSYCLEFMSGPNGLRQNICSTHTPGVLVDNVPEDQLRQFIPPELQYACLHWVDHLHKSSIGLSDGDSVHGFLGQHFLSWLEALGWVKSVSTGIRAIISLESIAQRFAMYGQMAIRQAPLQVYCSALVFAPTKSIVKKQFEGQIPRWIKRLPVMEEDWNALLQTLEGHVSSVTAVVFSRDGKVLASASQDSTVRLWDADTGAILHKLEDHSDRINAIVFSPDGRLIVSASRDATVKLWNAATGTLERTFNEHLACVNGVVFSPNGNLIISGSNDRIVGMWDMSRDGLHYKLHGHSSRVNTVVFSPCGRMIASASDDRTLKLWDPVERTCLRTLVGHTGRVRDVKFSPDSSRVASASYDNTIRLWDLTTEAFLLLEGHSGWANTIDFTPDGSVLVSASDDCTVRLWSVATGKEQQKIKSYSTAVRFAAYSPSGNFIVTAPCDASIELWDSATETMLQPLTGHTALVNAIAISPNGRLIASASNDGTVKLWDINMHAMQQFEHQPLPVSAVGFSPDGTTFAFKSSDGTVTQCDSLSGSPQQTSVNRPGRDMFLTFSHSGFISQSPTGAISLWHSAQEACTTATPGAAVSIDKDWVCQGGHKLFWLPQDYRPTCVATTDNAILLGHESRSATYFEIDPSYGF